jgi:hypothetical protein
MEDYKLAKLEEQVAKEVFNENLAAHLVLKEQYAAECASFIKICAHDFHSLFDFYSSIGREKHHFYTFSYLFTGLNSLLISFRLLLLGYLPASGNMKRQFIESIAMSALCADNKIVPIERIENGRFTSNGAVKKLVKNAKKLRIEEESISWFKPLYESYHEQSHASFFSLGSAVSFEETSIFFAIGSVFDQDKKEIFDAQISNCIKLANIFDNILAGTWYILNRDNN